MARSQCALFYNAVLCAYDKLRRLVVLWAHAGSIMRGALYAYDYFGKVRDPEPQRGKENVGHP